MKLKTTFAGKLALIAGIIILINILSNQLFLRIDITQDQRYKLSKATRNILKDLNEPVTVSAYFTSDLPPQYIRVRSEFKELLIEYGSLSRGMVVYEMIDPNKDEESERQAMQAGVQPVIVNVRERDQVKQQKAYMGAVVKMGSRKEVIPFIQPDAAMEYALSTAIKKLSVTNKPLIGIIKGHGEPSLQQMQQAMAAMLVLYNVEEVNLGDSALQLSKYKTLAIIGPTDSIPEHHLNLLDAYLAGGGNLLVAINRVKGDFSTLQGSSVETGLESWLMKKGIVVESSFITDASCGTVGVTQQGGFFTYTTNISFPYLPVIKQYADHPITKGLGMVMLQFASPISYTGDTSIVFTPIAFSSEKSSTQAVPMYFNVQRQWTERDFPMSNLVVAATLEGKLSGNMSSRMVVFGDADFPVAEGRQQLQPDNVSLLVNAIDWLSDDTGLIALRTKGVKARPLDEIEDSRKVFLKTLNFLLPILIIIGFGIFRILRNRSIRMKRMEDIYV